MARTGRRGHSRHALCTGSGADTPSDREAGSHTHPQEVPDRTRESVGIERVGIGAPKVLGQRQRLDAGSGA